MIGCGGNSNPGGLPPGPGGLQPHKTTVHPDDRLSIDGIKELMAQCTADRRNESLQELQARLNGSFRKISDEEAIAWARSKGIAIPGEYDPETGEEYGRGDGGAYGAQDVYGRISQAG